MSSWRPDPLLAGFEALELQFPDDYDGPVVATLVRLPAGEPRRGAALYLHGYADYFFQRHMAERFAAEGYAFYAVDLRKHGRSLRPHQHPNFCKNVREYYADLDCIVDDELWNPGVWNDIRALYNWGPPVPASFIAPDDLLELVAASQKR